MSPEEFTESYLGGQNCSATAFATLLKPKK